jgi:TonB family protein
VAPIPPTPPPAPLPIPASVAPVPVAAPAALTPPVIAPALPVTPPPPVTPPQPLAPVAAAPAPSPATPEPRKAAKTAADLDLAALEELARPRRKGDTAAPPRPATPASPAPSAASPTPASPPAAPASPIPAPTAPPVAAPTGARSVAPGAPSSALATQPIRIVGDGQGERFGQYTLLEKIAAGGMAEVWKARMRGVEGFQKTVAIKKILPHLTDNAEFIGMFIDEAKLAAQLSHPNIIHIYDLGKIGRDYYIAMEYVEGRDLRSIMNAARKKGLPLPLGLAVLIASRLASALEYAHRKRDFEGHELGLVHRDVSPQNVLITFEGDIKLCDFGIAKAVTKASQTQMGALKGKLQYMSPEQAWGKAVDSRSDIFSLGAILFEMLTGERLFPGDSEMSVLEAVREGRTRSAREVSPAVPPEVDEIVRKALATEPGARFASAGELQSRLESVLYGLKPTPGPTDLAAYLHRLVQTDDAAASAPTAAAPTAPLPAPEPAGDDGAPAMQPAADLAPPAPLAPVAAVAGLPADLGGEAERRGRMILVAAIVAALVVLALLSYFLLRKRGTAPPPPAPAAAAAKPAVAPVTPGPAAAPGPAPAPAGAAKPVAGPNGRTKVDVSGLVNQELAKREGDLRKKFEDEQKRLELELSAAKAKGAAKNPPAPASAAKTAAASTAAAPPPAAAPAVSGSAPPQPSEPPPAARPEARPEPGAEAPAPAAAAPSPPEPTAPAPPKAQVGELVEEGADVTNPRLVSFSKPEYPALARRLGVQGVVVVSVLVDENGHVQDAKLSQSIRQNVGLNEAALGAARSAVFRSATKSGVRVKMWTKLKIPFKL